MSCNAENATHCSEGVAELMSCEDSLKKPLKKTRRQMARERRGAGYSLVSMEAPYWKQYIKDVLYAVEKRSIKTNLQKCKTIVCIANTFTHKSFYTQMLLHTDPFTHRPFYTQSFYPQKLLHTEAFTHIRFHTDAVMYTDTFTQTLLHTKLLPTEAFTYRSFYTHTLLHRCFYTQTLLHTDTFTHRHF